MSSGPSDLFRRGAERADALAGAEEGGAARPFLRFAASLLRLQARLAGTFEACHALEPLTGSLSVDLSRLAPSHVTFLAAMRASPARVVADEAALRLSDPGLAEGRLLECWEARTGGREGFLCRGFLRPYLATLRHAGVAPGRSGPLGGCGFCGGPPGVGYLRAVPESEGAGRHLVCAFCGNENPMARIRCPACGEQDPGKLPVFRSEKHPEARIEACDTCRRYLKAVDLTVDARPVPEVDEIVSVSMDLWAEAEGYRRIEPGIAGF